MKKIIIVSACNATIIHRNDRYAGGVEAVCETMADALHKKGHQVTLICSAEQGFTRDYKVIYKTHIKNSFDKSKFIKDTIKLEIAREEPDVIFWNHNSQATVMADVASYFGHMMPKNVYIEHIHTQFSEMGQANKYAGMLRMKSIGTTMLYACRSLQNDWPLTMSKKRDWVMSKLHKTVDPKVFDEFKEYDGYIKIAYNKEPVTVEESSGRGIFIGRLDNYKRPLLAAEAYKAIGIHADFFVADDQDSDTILPKLKKFEEEGCITIHLNAPRQELLDTLKTAKMNILTGLDTFCLSGFEAMSYGVPCLFLIKDNLKSGIKIDYDYLTDDTRFIINTVKVPKKEIFEKASTMVPLMPCTIEERQRVADHLYSEYNYDTFIESIENWI